jgi:hypothetical protein
MRGAASRSSASPIWRPRPECAPATTRGWQATKWPARKGNIHLRTIPVGAAVSASRTRGGYLKDKYHRLKARRGPMGAALAIAHKILVVAYHMLTKGIAYQDLGET